MSPPLIARTWIHSDLKSEICWNYSRMWMSLQKKSCVRITVTNGSSKTSSKKMLDSWSFWYKDDPSMHFVDAIILYFSLRPSSVEFGEPTMELIPVNSWINWIEISPMYYKDKTNYLTSAMHITMPLYSSTMPLYSSTLLFPHYWTLQWERSPIHLASPPSPSSDLWTC